MPHDQANSSMLGELEQYATDIACWRVEAIENGMLHEPNAFPDYAKARTDIERERAAIIQKLGGDDLALEPLVNAMMA